VNCVSPAFIVQDEHRERYDRTDNVAYREIAEHCHPLRRVGMSDDVANAVLFLCSPQATFINGHTVVLDGGATLQDQFCLLRDFDLSGRKE
jgi:NAD(P)-dependent dehydrogenase (short-subunit alcohol dehydrogenase family)